MTRAQLIASSTQVATWRPIGTMCMVPPRRTLDPSITKYIAGLSLLPERVELGHGMSAIRKIREPVQWTASDRHAPDDPRDSGHSAQITFRALSAGTIWLNFAEKTAKPSPTFLPISRIISNRDNLTLNDRNHRFSKVVGDRKLSLSPGAPGADAASRRVAAVLASLHPAARCAIVSRHGQKSLQSRCSSAPRHDPDRHAGYRLRPP